MICNSYVRSFASQIVIFHLLSHSFWTGNALGDGVLLLKTFFKLEVLLSPLHVSSEG